MKIIGKKISLVFYIIVIILLFVTFNLNFKLTNIYSYKLSDKVLEQINQKSDDEKIGLLVHFDQKENELKNLERTKLIEKLKLNQKSEQKETLEYLNNKIPNQDIKSFYIVNLISCKIDKNILKDIISFEKVKYVELDENKDLRKTEALQEKEYNAKDPDWNLKMILADKVWEEGVKGDNVTVGIIDTGIDIEHPALKRKFRGYDKSTGNITYDGNFFDALESNTAPNNNMDRLHGTHVAGIILGSEYDSLTNTEYNKVGVAPNANFINARVFDKDKQHLQSNHVLIKAAQWMLNPNGNAALAPKIINNSWGGGVKDRWFQATLNTWRNAGILPVFASGNKPANVNKVQPGSIDVPAAYLESYAVGAVNDKAEITLFSHVGPSKFAPNVIKPDISAPGEKIWSSVEDGKYGFLSGTSMACPHVAGVAALLLSKDNTLTDKKIEDLINKTAFNQTDKEYKDSPNYGYGHGIVNAYFAYLSLTNKDFYKLYIENKNINNELVDMDITILFKNGERIYTKKLSNFTFNLPQGEYKIVARHKNFIQYEKDIKLDNDTNILFEEQDNNQVLNISIKDKDNNKITNSFIKLIKDNVYKTFKTDAEGNKKIEIPYGKYILKINEPGYNYYEKEIDFSKTNKEIEVILEKQNILFEVFKKHNGIANTNVNGQLHIGNTNAQKFAGYEGGAIKVELTKPMKLESLRIHFMQSNLNQFHGTSAILEIRKYDNYKRIIKILDNYEFSFIPGELNEISLTDFDIVLNGTFYVLIKNISNEKKGFVVGVDTSQTINNNSYVVDSEYLYDLSEINTASGKLKGELLITAVLNDNEKTANSTDLLTNPIIDLLYDADGVIKTRLTSPNNYLKVFFNNKTSFIQSDNSGVVNKLITAQISVGDVIKFQEISQDGRYSKIVKVFVLPNYNQIKYLQEILKDIYNKKQIPQLKNKIDNIGNNFNYLKENTKIENNSYQQTQDNILEIEKIVNALKDSINQFSDYKKELIDTIRKAKEYLLKTKISEDGSDIFVDEVYAPKVERDIFKINIKAAEKAYLEDFEQSVVFIDNEKLKLAIETFQKKVRAGLKPNTIKIIIEENNNLITNFKEIFYYSNVGRYESVKYKGFFILEDIKEDILKTIEIEEDILKNMDNLSLQQGYNKTLKQIIIKTLDKAITMSLLDYQTFNKLNTDKIKDFDKFLQLEKTVNEIIQTDDITKKSNETIKFITKENDLILKNKLCNLYFRLSLNYNNLDLIKKVESEINDLLVK